MNKYERIAALLNQAKKLQADICWLMRTGLNTSPLLNRLADVERDIKEIK